ncbi:hypothetical protein HELRODRAFT_178502 [Helobdella robusta]|uniref:Uncharacterized protein n=1 Tax=Helobdella robusta TaxID=6412 RepID=T1FD99_HELRO|nr:hypothetical protein HELRODRAFT_178502 [Helobdella robusta]ESN97055.1 hypothetical protein HELRODRAFT_178502 [Helobdella robusta]
MALQKKENPCHHQPVVVKQKEFFQEIKSHKNMETTYTVAEAVGVYVKAELIKSFDDISIIGFVIFVMYWNASKFPIEGIDTVFTSVGQSLAFNSKNVSLLLNGPGATMGFQIVLHANQSDFFILKDYSSGYKMTRLKHPHGDCIDQLNYQQVKCEQACLARTIIDNCNCRPIYIEELVNDIKKNYRDGKFGDVHCFFCPPMCNEIYYHASVTESKLSNISKIWLKKHSQHPLFTNDFLNLKVFSSSMHFTKFTDIATYSEIALLIDIGGALGLLLGSAFLTVIEVLELLWNLFLYVSYKTKFKMRKSNSN